MHTHQWGHGSLGQPLLERKINSAEDLVAPSGGWQCRELLEVHQEVEDEVELLMPEREQLVVLDHR